MPCSSRRKGGEWRGLLRGFFSGLLGPALLLLLVKLPARTLAISEECKLESLALRYKDRPIDLVPPFEGNVFSYTAALDFSMDSYSVDVRPVSGCDVDAAPNQAIPVQIGGSHQLTLFARHPETGTKQAYTIKVTRLLGSETELQALRVLGAEISPVFDPTVRAYTVMLSLGYDQVKVFYTLRDNDQRVRVAAQAEYPTGAEEKKAQLNHGGSASLRRLQAAAQNSSSYPKAESFPGPVSVAEERALLLFPMEPTGARGYPELNVSFELVFRRLAAASGEVQYRETYEDFLVDVGFTRRVVLTIQSADPTQANIGTYTLTAIRPGCTLATPYYDPTKKFCVNNCESGFYRNGEINRCSKCNTNCGVCANLLKCMLCTADDIDYTYVVQPDGSCLQAENHIFKKYWWWCVGFGTFLLFLVCIGCAGIMQCIFGRRRRQGGPVGGDDFSDDDSEVEFALPRGNKRGGGGRTHYGG